MTAEFDPYAKNYDRVLAESLPLSGDVDRFAAYKIDEVAHRRASQPMRRILDFGCGVGRSLPFLTRAFPAAEVWAYEPSPDCVEVARAREPKAHVTAQWYDVPLRTFDCVVAANVFHHVLPSDRLDAMRRCRDALAEGASFFVFEHNPLNPVTRRIFDRCPFDRGASMIDRAALMQLGVASGLRVQRKAYTLFVPFAGRIAAALQRRVAWLPLGAQYYVEFVR
jgi:SAM-dependent methyltransferase